MEEIFKDCKGYEDYFQVSNTGKILSKKTNKLRKTCVHKNGYEVFTIRLGGRGSKTKCLKVHRVVALTFIENPQNKSSVNHIDCDKLNNIVNNLEWVTFKENTVHAVKNNLINYRTGNSHPNSLLTHDLVVQIKEMKREGIKRKEICKILNLKTTLVNNILYNRSWKHVD